MWYLNTAIKIFTSRCVRELKRITPTQMKKSEISCIKDFKPLHIYIKMATSTVISNLKTF